LASTTEVTKKLGASSRSQTPKSAVPSNYSKEIAASNTIVALNMVVPLLHSQSASQCAWTAGVVSFPADSTAGTVGKSGTTMLSATMVLLAAISLL
jgi:hypothetical protein